MNLICADVKVPQTSEPPTQNMSETGDNFSCAAKGSSSVSTHFVLMHIKRKYKALKSAKNRCVKSSCCKHSFSFSPLAPLVASCVFYLVGFEERRELQRVSDFLQPG